MRESLFHTELAATFRKAGCWIYKIPDQSVGRSEAAVGQAGKLRFNLPKPCDLVGCRAPDGRFLAIEAKLIQARSFRLDARLVRQVETLRQLGSRGAWASLAINFRFDMKRPMLTRVNRAFLVRRLDGEWSEGARWTLADAEVLAIELPRVTGGWALPAAVWQ